ncbi:hypothetical protein Tco_0078218 [Tanacetum coccineum]
MDDPNITIEEYIILVEEKAHRHGRTFNWQTATYGKMEYCEDEDDSFTNLETEYPAIVFDDTSDTTLSCEPAVSPLNNNEIDFKISLDESDDEDYMVCHLYHLGIRGTHGSNTRLRDMARILYTATSRGSRRYGTVGDRLSMVYTGDEGQELFTSHAWRRLFEIRAPLVREFILEFLSTCMMSDTEIGLDVADKLCFQLGGARCMMTWRQFILVLGLHTEEDMAEARFGAYWQGSERVVPDKGGLRDYWMEISSDNDFLGPAPSYVFIREPYLFRHAEGRKSGARLSRGHFIGRLAAHFGLVSYQRLRGLSVVTSELPLIDLHKLGRLNISAEDAHAADEGAHADPAPVQAPQPPPPTPKTIQHRVSRLEEEVQELRGSIIGLGLTYQDFDITLVGSSQLPYQRHTRRRTDDDNTLAPQQPDP